MTMPTVALHTANQWGRAFDVSMKTGNILGWKRKGRSGFGDNVRKSVLRPKQWSEHRTYSTSNMTSEDRCGYDGCRGRASIRMAVPFV